MHVKLARTCNIARIEFHMLIPINQMPSYCPAPRGCLSVGMFLHLAEIILPSTSLCSQTVVLDEWDAQPEISVHHYFLVFSRRDLQNRFVASLMVSHSQLYCRRICLQADVTNFSSHLILLLKKTLAFLSHVHLATFTKLSAGMVLHKNIALLFD